jgi:ornithine cyclodeaminase/alanine dehydrogenase-like protein (mu-crystallin family)
MSTNNLRILSGRDVVDALPMKDAIEAMKIAFIHLSKGRAVAPQRIHLQTREPTGDALFMPSYLPGDRRMGVKVVTLLESNREIGLPLIQALMVLLDATTGKPLAVMDGAALTALRTGAASGAATDLMARPDASRAAVFGAGAQGRTQLEAVCAVRPIREAGVFDMDRALAESFAGEMAKRLDILVKAAASPAETLDGADVVCTATTSPKPVFSDGDLAGGVHINAVGSFKPQVREIPGETVKRSRVVVDHRPAAMEEAGDLIIPMEEGLISANHIYAELGQIAAKDKTGRDSDEEVTLFKSVGNAVQDCAAAQKAFANAERLNLGVSAPL